MSKIQHRHGLARKLAQSDDSTDEIVEKLFLSTLSRLPSEPELALMRQAFDDAGSSRRAAVEDVLWALLNMKEYIFNH
jgi:hypothetical protein